MARPIDLIDPERDQESQRAEAAKNPDQRDLSGGHQKTITPKVKENGKTWDARGDGVRAEDTDRNREKERKNSDDKEGSYTRKHERIRVTQHEKDREKEKSRQHERDMELARARRSPGNRTVVQVRTGGRGRQPEQGIDFSQGFLSGGLGGGLGYDSPFRGVSLGGGSLGFGQMSVGKMGLGLGQSRGAYADPFAGVLKLGTPGRGSTLDLTTGIFGRQGSATASRSLLTQGIFGGQIQSLFGGSPAPARRKAPRKPTPARKKPAAKGKPAIYGNPSAAKGGAVVVQKNGKTRKIPVKKLPSKKRR